MFLETVSHCHFLVTLKMEKLINYFTNIVNEAFGRLFRKIFPVLRVIVAVLNGLVGLSGLLTVLITIVLYIVPRFHLVVDSMKEIFSIHSIFLSLMIVGIASTSIAGLGFHLLRKKDYEKLGLQGASFLILLIVMVALTFTFSVEWESKAYFSLSYSTQIYSPIEKNHNYFESIQRSLHCCGSTGPSDFDIGNEYFKRTMAPISCCDFEASPKLCARMTRLENIGKGSLAIPAQLAFKTGCMERMENIFWPGIIIAILSQSSLAFLCMIVTSILCIGHNSYLSNSESVKNKVEILPRKTSQ